MSEQSEARRKRRGEVVSNSALILPASLTPDP
jgi:hypothetical protein